MEPGWKNDADYAYTEQLDANGWAFEFLRRDPDYRMDFEKVYSTKEQLKAQHGPYKDNESAWRQDKRAWIYEPPIKKGETRKHWMLRSSAVGLEPKRNWFLDWYRAKWGLVTRFPDPSYPADPTPEFNALDEFPLFPKYAEVGEFFEGDEADGNQMSRTAVVVFDLWRPLKEQIKAATVQLIARAKEQMAEEKVAHGTAAKPQLKGHKTGNALIKFRQYLRTLDGVAAGAKPKEIAVVIFGLDENEAATGFSASKRGAEKIQTAQSFAKLRYLSIPLMNLTSE